MTYRKHILEAIKFLHFKLDNNIENIKDKQIKNKRKSKKFLKMKIQL